MLVCRRSTGRTCLVVVLLYACVGLLASTRAHAGQAVLIAEPGAWPDSRDEAYVLTIWLRAQLERAGGAWASVNHPDIATVDAGKAKEQLTRLGAAGAITLDTDAHGMTLTVRVRYLPLFGEPQAAVFKGSRKNLLGIARSLGRWAGQLPGVTGLPVDVTIGELAPYAMAAQAIADKDLPRAHHALLGADPRIAARFPVLGEVPRLMWTDRRRSLEERLTIATRLAPPAQALSMVDDARGSMSSDKLELARARAFLRLGRLADAATELARAKDSTGDAVWLLTAEVAEGQGRADDRDEAMGHIADLSQPEVLAFVVTLAPGALPAPLEQRIVAEARRLDEADAFLASAIGERSLKGGNSGPSTLSLLAIEDLSDSQASALAELLGGMPESSVSLRLRAELHARAEQPKLALADADKALSASPRDPQALRLRGELRLGDGQFKEGTTDLEAAAAGGDKGSATLRVHALDLAGDCAGALTLAQASELRLPRVDVLRLQGCAAQDMGDLSGARKLLEEALALAPDDARLAEAWAALLELQKDPAAVTARARAVRLTQAGLAADHSEALAATLARARGAAAAPVEGNQAPAEEPAMPPVTTTASKSGDRASRVALATSTADRLGSFLAAFNELNQPGRKVVIVPLSGSHESPIYPWQVHPLVLEDALALAIARPPYRAQVVGGGSGTLSEPLSKERLTALGRAAGADVVLLYGLRGKGFGKAEIRLIMYRLDWQDPHVYEHTIADATGLITTNRGFFAFFLAVLIVGVLIAAFFVIRGWGSLVVRIKKDPAVLDEAYCVRVHATEDPPTILEPASFADVLRRGGVRADRRRTILATSKTTFTRLPPGVWYAHVWGTHKKGGDLRVLPRLTQQVRVRRGKASDVEFDLVPAGAELRVTVFDGEAPMPSAKVWLDESSAHVEYTDAYGVAHMVIGKGRHSLHVLAGGLRIDKNLDIATTKVVTLTINLARERAAQELGQGLQVGSAEEASDMSIETSSGQTINVSGSQAPAEAPRAKPARAATPLTVARGSEPAVDAAQRTPAAVGQAVSRYARLAELGRGAMGVVYRARDQVLERDVAMKVISDEVRAIPQALQLFMQEARALAALNHPNIVAVYDQGYDEEGHAFMVMEWVEGETLESLLERAGGRLPLRHTLAITKQLLEGIAFAHSKRVVHRDIKPANVFVSADGRVKIGDFGLAKVMRELQIQRTEVRGTPLYIAPEQIFGADLDHRADLYAIACTIFEMFAGRPPFIDGDVLYHHVHSVAPLLSTFAAEAPRGLDEVLARGLAKKSVDRYASAEELCRAVLTAGMLGLQK
jgi:tetratricopeptide (TPR) repeat protein